MDMGYNISIRTRADDMEFDAYCALYVDTDLGIDELYGRIYSYLGGDEEAVHIVLSP
ncbi:MAG: hypothetical protein J6Y81_09935 [Ruminococcus sp.]|nr:hypothetical protein [Ruminococcus sp.]